MDRYGFKLGAAGGSDESLRNGEAKGYGCAVFRSGGNSGVGSSALRYAARGEERTSQNRADAGAAENGWRASEGDCGGGELWTGRSFGGAQPSLSGVRLCRSRGFADAGAG